MRSSSSIAIAALISVAGASSLVAQAPPAATEAGGAFLASVLVPAKGGAKLTVSTPAFANGADIPMDNTQYKGNVFPGLQWSGGPSGTKSYAIIMQDADGVRNGQPFLHWTMVNIPPGVTKLDAAMAAPPAGAMYGPNYRGANQPYLGPRTPAGPKHRYHLQVFALDILLTPEALASITTITDAIKDHVLASGEVVGLGSAPAPGATK